MDPKNLAAEFFKAIYHRYPTNREVSMVFTSSLDNEKMNLFQWSGAPSGVVMTLLAAVGNSIMEGSHSHEELSLNVNHVTLQLWEIVKALWNEKHPYDPVASPEGGVKEGDDWGGPIIESKNVPKEGKFAPKNRFKDMMGG